MLVSFLFVFDKSFTFYLGWPFGHLLGKSCSLGFPLVLFLLCAVLIVRVPFQFGVYGMMRNLIVSVPDHCLFFYFTTPRDITSHTCINKKSLGLKRHLKFPNSRLGLVEPVHERK